MDNAAAALTAPPRSCRVGARSWSRSCVFEFLGVVEERKKEKGETKKKERVFSVSSRNAAAAAGSLSLPVVFAHFPFSSQRAGRKLTRALPSIRAHTLRALLQAPPPIERSNEGGGKESGTGAFFSLALFSFAAAAASFSSSPRHGAREEEKRSEKRVASREQKKKTQGPW